jgi:hypothetical protein
MLRIALFALAAFAVLVLAVRLGQRKLLYFPFGRPPNVAHAEIPGAQEVELRTEDGLTLRAWHVPASNGPARAAVIVFPGNAGHRGDRRSIAAGLSRRRFDVLLVDYRGYGGNPGKPTEAGLARDARAARRLLVEERGVDPARLLYFGESLGAAVALGLAAEAEPRALVLRSPFASLADVARVHYPFLPLSLILVESYPSLERAARIRCPVLVVAGDRDRVIPVAQSRAVEAALASSHKRLLILPGADHNDAELVAGDRLLDEVERLWSDTVEGT